MANNDLWPKSFRQFDNNGPLVQSLAEKTVPVSGSVYVGIGYEPRTNTSRNRALKEDVTPPKAEPTNKPVYAFQYVESYSEIASHLSVSMSAGYGAEGISGGGASLSIFKSTRIERSRAYVVFRMRMIANEKTTQSAKLNDEVLKLITKKQYPSLVEKYGTSYAKTVRYGGELAAILEFKSDSQVDTEKFHQEIDFAVGEARAEASMDSSIMKLTKGRSVAITYAQSGGTTGHNQNGVFAITIDELIQRIRSFAGEVWGTNGLDGSTVPIEADMASLRQATNWPAEDNTNLDYPYPPDIESTAMSVDMLYQKLSEIDSILSSPAVIAPSVREAASAMRPYLEYQSLQAKLALIGAMASTVSPIVVKGESFYQYRIRGMLNVWPSASRENAGGDIDLTSPDKGQLATKLFGAEIPFEVRPWPDVKLTDDWGYQGELDKAAQADDSRIQMFAVGHHVACWQDGGNPDALAAQLAGKASPEAKNDGIFAYALKHPKTSGGKRCGYSVVHFLAFRINVPDKTLLPPLPSIPQTEIVASLQQEPPKYLGEDKWVLPFSVNSPSAKSCGAYTITVHQKSAQGKRRETEISAYWIGLVPDLKLKNTITVDSGWEVESFSVTLNSAYGE
ncbi:hypothetical protein [Cupriavidus oxalaticus]|uniref:MACPF domain-containing protein n=1 Tax=Cupriavidus oxalaticus TaxID=96344 RepID=A0A4P7LIM3_9BURK|nr:hypothetical protein [Cupriavidus oxalaticus]QBY56010.1 hypothetical protein E0W60_33680 [Cupriavidus oxalaticus]